MTRSLARTLTAALLFLLAPTPGLAQTADFTGSLTIFTGAGSGLPTTATPILGGANDVSFGGGAFTLPAGVFTLDATQPVGFTANASPSSIYTIRTITNTSTAAGSFAGSGGVMGSGSNVTVELGLVPLPNVFGSLVLPVNVGSPGTAIANAGILTNAVTVSVVAASWTTGTAVVADQTASAPSGTVASSATVSGTNSLGAGGGAITLVSPFLVRIRGAATENRAGYAVLQLDFIVPEPAIGALLAGAFLWVAARRRA